MRPVRVGNKNWQVTEAASKVAAAWDCKPVEGAFFVSRFPPSPYHPWDRAKSHWTNRHDCAECHRHAVVPADAKR
ncbi:hypothetical protein F5148DRAFT_1245355, partial [Russula earlei]